MAVSLQIEDIMSLWIKGGQLSYFLERREKKKATHAQISHCFCVIEILITKGLFSRSYSQLIKKYIYNKNISPEFWQCSRILAIFRWKKKQPNNKSTECQVSSCVHSFHFLFYFQSHSTRESLDSLFTSFKAIMPSFWVIDKTLCLLNFNEHPQTHGYLIHPKSEMQLYSTFWCVCAQSCPTLCEPMDCSPSGSFVHGLQGKNTGVCCHFLFQGIFSTLGLSL